jgi:heat shock protein HslJ
MGHPPCPPDRVQEVDMRRLIVSAICWAFIGTLPAPAAADAPLTGRFLMLDGQVHLSGCDGWPPVRVQIGDAYAEVASAVHPRRHAPLNAVELSVQATRQPAAQAGGAAGESLRVTRVVAVGPAVECNVSGKHRPLVGTRWVMSEPLTEIPATGAAGAGRERRFSFTLTADGGLSGFDGCNSFMGRATVARHGQGFEVKKFLSTLVACPPTTRPAPSLLQGTYAAEIAGRRLTLGPQRFLFVADDNP